MTFSEEFKNVIDIICEKLGVAIDWTQENIVPWLTDILHRYVKFNIVTSALEVIVTLLVLITGLVFIIITAKAYKKAKLDKKGSILCDIEDHLDSASLTITGMVLAIIGGGMFLMASIFIPLEITELLEWIIVPEVSLVKELTSMIST